mgnify:CR=1 FL=1
MDNLKKLMGDSYKDGITVEEINKFLGTGKFVNLVDGNYVDKDKYNKVISERDQIKASLVELTDKTKDYDALKAENDTFKGEKKDAELKATLSKLGIDDKAFKYVKGDIADKTLVITEDEKANKAAVTEYLKANPQFAAKGQSGSGSRVITTKVLTSGDGQQTDNHKDVNDKLRAAFGVKTSA